MGLCEHSVKFTNCKSSAVVTSDGGNNSGFVGWSRSSSYLISFDGCLFNGKLLMKDNNGGYNGGFVGWKGDAKTVTIDNCLYIPAATVSGEKLANSGSATFCRQHDDKLPAEIKNSYYNCSNTQDYGAVQGKAPLRVTAGENVTVEAVSLVGGSTKTYNGSGIKAYAQGIIYDGTFYYGSGDKVSLRLSHGETPEGYAFFTGYTASPEGATLTGNGNPYTLTMPNSNVQIGAAFASPIPYINENGEKQTCSDYSFITNDMTAIGIANEETWYVVEGDVTINKNFGIKGNVHLILADGSSLTVDATNDSDYNAIYIDSSDGRDGLTIYGQDKGNGRLTINGKHGIYIGKGNLTINGGNVDVDAQIDGINISQGNLTINGGKVDVDTQGEGIYISQGNLTINGGKVDVDTQGEGIKVSGTITFGWTRPEDHIYSNSYSPYSTVNIAPGQALTDGTNFFAGNIVNVKDLYGKTLFGVDVNVLYNASDNDIASLNGKNTDILLCGRTLYKDGSWNTLCLPFDLTLSGSILEGNNVQLMTLGDASFSNGTLTLNFVKAEEIKAGVPYIIKWNEGSNIVNPMFKNVTIDNASLDENAFTNSVISFKGIFSPFKITEANKKLLYMGDGNLLYYPSGAMTIRAFRAYFQLASWLVNENLGDVNGDNQISVSDVMAMVDYVLGNSNGNILKENADVNSDGAISVSDVMELVNMVIGGHKNQFKLVVNTGDETVTYDSIRGSTGPARAQESTIWDE